MELVYIKPTSIKRSTIKYLEVSSVRTTNSSRFRTKRTPRGDFFRYAKTGKPILAVFVDDSRQKLANEEDLVAVCDKFDVNAVMVDEPEAVVKYGLGGHQLPAYVYFEDGVPSVYEDQDDDDDPEEDPLLAWIEEHVSSFHKWR